MCIFAEKYNKTMAISKEIFRNIIREGQEEIINVELYDRPIDFEENGRYVFVGVRQAGKSYMLYKRAKQLINNGYAVEDFVYINFDDERLYGMTVEDFDTILQAYNSMYNHKPLLFFDEIQNIDGWEHFARRMANQKYRIFITGSNAKMLSRDIQTTLGGRYIETMIYPYSFHEFIEAQGITLDKQWKYGAMRSEVQIAFSMYMEWGGFPELLQYRNKRRWINDLYEKIILGDIILRNKVKNEAALRMAIKRLADNVMQPTSYNRLANLIKGAGINTTVSSIIEYVKYAKDACLLFSIENYASKFVEKETVKKHYFMDNGLLNIFLIGNKAALLENLCAIHLLRAHGNNLYFYNKNIEIDFYIPEEGHAIQVSYSIEDEETRQREIDALKKFACFQPLNKMTIITFDEEETITLNDGKTITVIPVWKWLLDDNTISKE